MHYILPILCFLLAGQALAQEVVPETTDKLIVHEVMAPQALVQEIPAQESSVILPPVIASSQTPAQLPPHEPLFEEKSFGAAVTEKIQALINEIKARLTGKSGIHSSKSAQEAYADLEKERLLPPERPKKAEPKVEEVPSAPAPQPEHKTTPVRQEPATPFETIQETSTNPPAPEREKIDMGSFLNNLDASSETDFSALLD